MNNFKKQLFALSFTLSGLSFAGPIDVDCTSADGEVTIKAIFGSEGSVLSSIKWKGVGESNKFPADTQLFNKGGDDAQFNMTTTLGDDAIAQIEVKTVGSADGVDGSIVTLGGVAIVRMPQVLDNGQSAEKKKVVPVSCLASI